MIHIIFGLLAAFVLVAFFRALLSPNDDLTAAIAALLVGLIVCSGSYCLDHAYKYVTNWQDPQMIREQQLINRAIEFEDSRLDIEINGTLNGHRMPMHLKGVAYWCRAIGKVDEEK